LASILVTLPRISAHFTPNFISLTRGEHQVNYAVLELFGLPCHIPLRWCLLDILIASS
jgi:hypothetical protein